jgi:PKD repeat protein
LLCLIATVQAAQDPQRKTALAQLNHVAAAEGQPKKVSPADIAKRYQLQPGIQGQLTLTPASQTTTTNVPVTVTANCGSGFSCSNFHFVWGDGKEDDSTTASASHPYSDAQSYTVYATAHAVPHYTIMMMSSHKPPPPLKSNPVTVTVTAPDVSVVTLDARPPRVRVGDSVALTATLTPADPDARFVFNHGDDSSSPLGSNIDTHVYHIAKDYQVSVTAYNSDNNGVASSNAVPVSVVQLPPPVLTVDAVPGQDFITGKAIRFDASSRPAPPEIQYQFHWNDGTPDEIAGAEGIATHVFSTSGTKRVTVIGLTEESFAGPINGRTELVINHSWPPPWLLMLALAALATAVTSRWKWIKARGAQVKTTQLTSTHQVRLTGGSYPQVSFELDPGLESAKHSVIVTTTHSKQETGANPALGG